MRSKCCVILMTDHVLYIVEHYLFADINNDRMLCQKEAVLECLRAQNLDGASILEMNRKDFASLFVVHCDDKKLRGPISKIPKLLEEFDLHRLGIDHQINSQNDDEVDIKPLSRASTTGTVNVVVEGLADCTMSQIVIILKDPVFSEKVAKFEEQREVFVSYFEQNGVDGQAFLKLKRKQFSAVIVEHGANKKLNAVAVKVFKVLSEWTDWSVVNVDTTSPKKMQV